MPLSQSQLALLNDENVGDLAEKRRFEVGGILVAKAVEKEVGVDGFVKLKWNLLRRTPVATGRGG